MVQITCCHPVDATGRQTDVDTQNSGLMWIILQSVMFNIQYVFVFLVMSQNHRQEEVEVLGTTVNICLVCQVIAQQHQILSLFPFLSLNILSYICLTYWQPPENGGEPAARRCGYVCLGGESESIEE